MRDEILRLSASHAVYRFLPRTTTEKSVCILTTSVAVLLEPDCTWKSSLVQSPWVGNDVCRNNFVVVIIVHTRGGRVDAVEAVTMVPIVVVARVTGARTALPRQWGKCGQGVGSSDRICSE